MLLGAVGGFVPRAEGPVGGIDGVGDASCCTGGLPLGPVGIGGALVVVDGASVFGFCTVGAATAAPVRGLRGREAIPVGMGGREAAPFAGSLVVPVLAGFEVPAEGAAGAAGGGGGGGGGAVLLGGGGAGVFDSAGPAMRMLLLPLLLLLLAAFIGATAKGSEWFDACCCW